MNGDGEARSGGGALEEAVFRGVCVAVFNVKQAESGEVQFDGGVLERGGEVGAEIAKSKGGGREGLEVVGGAKLGKAVDTRLVSASGGRGDPKSCQGRVSRAGVWGW